MDEHHADGRSTSAAVTERASLVARIRSQASFSPGRLLAQRTDPETMRRQSGGKHQDTFTPMVTRAVVRSGPGEIRPSG